MQRKTLAAVRTQRKTEKKQKTKSLLPPRRNSQWCFPDGDAQGVKQREASACHHSPTIRPAADSRYLSPACFEAELLKSKTVNSTVAAQTHTQKERADDCVSEEARSR